MCHDLSTMIKLLIKSSKYLRDPSKQSFLVKFDTKTLVKNAVGKTASIIANKISTEYLFNNDKKVNDYYM